MPLWMSVTVPAYLPWILHLLKLSLLVLPFTLLTSAFEEIQNILGVGKNAAYNLVKTKAFHSVRIGGNIRISKRSFDAWLDGKTDAMEEVQADE